MVETPIDSRELQANHYGLLFCTLLALLLILPFLYEGGFGNLFMEVLLLVVLLGALRAVWSDRRVVIAATLLGAGMFASPGWGLFEPSRATAFVSGVAMTGFVGIVCAALSVAVYQARSVDLGTILGAVSLYVLIGLLWFGVFGLIETLQPESFVFAEIHPGDAARLGGTNTLIGAHLAHRRQLFYYAFVTITTLGYGDIRPVSDVARIYATVAAMSGQLFLAVLVARLVGIQSAQHAARHSAV